MTLRVILTPMAEADLEEAAKWYELRAKLGETFVHQVEDTLDRISSMPELSGLAYQNVRRARVQRFSYGVFYRILRDHIEVLAVFHNRRDPRAWQARA